MVEKRLAALEGGVGALITSSGQAAVLITMLNLAEAGDEIITTDKIYGGTYNLFAVIMKKMGIDFTFIDPDCTEEELRAAFKPNTKALFGETVANPALTVLDFEKLY